MAALEAPTYPIQYFMIIAAGHSPEEDTPHMMVNVETSPATTPDDHLVEVVHASLAPRHLLPTDTAPILTPPVSPRDTLTGKSRIRAG